MSNTVGAQKTSRTTCANIGRIGLLMGAALGVLACAVGEAAADAMPTPAMAGPLAANPNPFSIELPDWMGSAAGKVYVTGAVSGIAYWQDNPGMVSAGDRRSLLDIDNAQVFVQKTDGWFQFFVQAGTYSLPDLGLPYLKSSATPASTFGVVPQAFIKLQGQGDWSAFSIQAGKLPTLIGDEYTFSFENMNIERGLLWNQENAVNQGVQANYSSGPLTLSVSWNDGFYSNRLNWLWGLASYGFNGGSDTVSVIGGGNLGHTGYSSFVNPSLQNNGSIMNVIYTHTSGPWTISPYIQYTDVPGATTWGGALLASYSFDDYWKVAVRGEYITSAGSSNVMYGPRSNAWSITLTPSYQWKQLFARADLAYVGAGGVTPGLGLGTGLATEQTRAMLEIGVLF